MYIISPWQREAYYTCTLPWRAYLHTLFEHLFYASASNDRGHIVFVLSVCLFVCLLSTLTFAITFEP